METVFSNVQEVDVGASITNAGNLPVPFENGRWESGDESLVQVIPTENPNVVTLRSTGAVGSTTVQFVADADLTEGELNVIGILDVNITESGEFRVNFEVSEPRRRPE